MCVPNKCTHTHMCVHICVYMYREQMCIYMYIYTDVHIYVHIYMYIHTTFSSSIYHLSYFCVLAIINNAVSEHGNTDIFLS